jgi:hypothetical protein
VLWNAGGYLHCILIPAARPLPLPLPTTVLPLLVDGTGGKDYDVCQSPSFELDPRGVLYIFL